MHSQLSREGPPTEDIQGLPLKLDIIKIYKKYYHVDFVMAGLKNENEIENCKKLTHVPFIMLTQL